MGPRQVGKSTLVGQFTETTAVPHDLFSADGVGKENTAWISEKWHEARMKMEIMQENEHILIIDEIQKIKNWSETVKKEWDKDTREKRNLKVILLGSSKLLIQKGLEESLAGRFETIRMGYWEWHEMRDAFGVDINEFIYFGGFPGLAPYINDEQRWQRMMEDSIVSPILSKDILEIEEIRNPALFRQVFDISALYSSQEMSLNKMQGAINSGTVPTIGSYLNILDRTMLAKPMQKYVPSMLRQKNSVPKLQVYNNAFKNMTGVHSFQEAMINLTEWGRQVESCVGAYLATRSVTDNFELLYWRISSGQEVDFILKRGEQIAAIEVKSGNAKKVSGLNDFRQLFKKQLGQSLIVGPEGLPLEQFFQIEISDLFRKRI
jgi:hypothetical protein